MLHINITLCNLFRLHVLLWIILYLLREHEICVFYFLQAFKKAQLRKYLIFIHPIVRNNTNNDINSLNKRIFCV